MEIYLDNGQLEDLKNGIESFATQLGKNEFTWITGHESENTTHFLSMRFFLHDKRGIVGIEFKVDNNDTTSRKICVYFLDVVSYVCLFRAAKVEL
ncbi:hypothetical protein [Halalkalibacter sp. APA_J-10(15)]|uniref:hypothetical protein n=1 Tax=Halalkalibacter sp. APA_J-10(15) TaxID=2933805 RepID=UPI001FF3359E|nr:hypothetical protein [Halalkalibacter sp. APA_J-10(15)]